MANYVLNIVTVIGDEKEVNEVIRFVKKDDGLLGTVDFEKIVPSPTEDMTSDELLDWRVTNWGTKWNAYEELELWEFKGRHGARGDVQLVFVTAWSPPENVIVQLSKMFPKVNIGHLWADEVHGVRVGEILYGNGEVIEYDVPTGLSQEAYEMYADVWDTDLKREGYLFDERTGTYKWSKEEWMRSVDEYNLS